MTDRELKRFASRFRLGVLDGRSSEEMCLAVCAPLQSLLGSAGVETKLIEGEVDCGDYNFQHFWLELSDGRILDPTADQFGRGMPKVYLGQLPAHYLKLDAT